MWLLYCNYSEKQLCLTIYVLQFWQGANHFVQSIWVLCEILSSLTFLLCCCVVAVQTKTISTWKPRQFAIGTIFRDKCCIFWQNCKGAYIFGHDCIYCCYLLPFCHLFYKIRLNILSIYPSIHPSIYLDHSICCWLYCCHYYFILYYIILYYIILLYTFLQNKTKHNIT